MYIENYGFKGRLRYRKDDDDGETPVIELPENQYSFDYTGGQQHIMIALETTLPSPGIPEAYFENSQTSKKLIGHNIDTNEVKGVTIPLLNGTIQWNETKYFREADLTKSMLGRLYRYRWHTNSAVWESKGMSFDIGEVLYLGASGSFSLKNRLWTINYRYAIGANRTAATDIVKGFTISKKAHDYIDVHMDYSPYGKMGAIKKPLGVKVHTLYNSYDINLLREGVVT